MDSNVSVIVRCKNEERWIGHCIQSVIDIFTNPQVLIVDNDSIDESMDICRMFEHHVDMTYKSIERYSPGRSLNLAVEHCKYDHVLIFSAHCQLLALNLATFKSFADKHACVFGCQIPVYRGRRISRRYVWSHFADEPETNMFSKTENRYFMHNAFAGYRKDILIKNKFDETLYGKEDRYWASKMIDGGYTVYYDPSMRCLHHWTDAGATWKGIG